MNVIFNDMGSLLGIPLILWPYGTTTEEGEAVQPAKFGFCLYIVSEHSVGRFSREVEFWLLRKTSDFDPSKTPDFPSFWATAKSSTKTSLLFTGEP